ncbi:ACT domain-containing protein [Spirosoma agri]|uniref:ACT domain-containing protein n=1 Tax=Spirosoma agri TaxID=1987381 RepID=A0A6M0ICU3_9BACT|nr:ACT domain-containing protein [Spirosoma agri]NEU65482.1 hypothetical protein [Spirosoma agri]
MNVNTNAIDWYQVSYAITGFDRPSFVRDIAEVIPQDDTCQLTQLCFEADGVRASGWLTVRVQQKQGFITIDNRLRAVRGIVSVKADQSQFANS